MIRVLFVDDEPMVLAGLRNRLRKQRRRWDMTFVEGGPQALEDLSRRPADVVVSDMRMPGMDGSELLHRVRAEHPGVMRVVLTGHANEEATMRAIPVAHQVLSKPCEAAVLERVIESAHALAGLIASGPVRDRVGALDSLPSMPHVYRQLVELMERDDVPLGRVAEVLEQDMAMTAKVLQLVNSAFYRLPRRITKVEEAVSYLGIATVRRLSLVAEVFSCCARVDGHCLDPILLQHHSLACALLTEQILEDRDAIGDAYLAGLLHDIGKIVLASSMPRRFVALLEDCRTSGRPLGELEHEALGCTHAEVGGFLLGVWGLPGSIVDAVTGHHEPPAAPDPSGDLVAAVMAADLLINEQLRSAVDARTHDVAVERFEAWGLADEVDGWREQAAAAIESARTMLPGLDS